MATHAESPEVTGVYRCPRCGNNERFTGTDVHGWGGPGACDGSCEEECVCETTLVQDFDVLAQGGGDVADIEYHAHVGGGDGAEIGIYTRIVCRDCGAVVWEETDDA